MFLLLTAHVGTNQIRVAVDSIESYEFISETPHQFSHTNLRTKTGLNLYIKESVESIDKSLQEGYTYIKIVGGR